MFQALIEKFSQHEDLKDALLATANTSIAEASTNAIWGIGLKLQNPDVWDTNKWSGKNIMGQMLEKVRDILK